MRKIDYPISVTNQICNICRINKPSNMFTARGRRKNGLSVSCKICMRTRAKIKYEPNYDFQVSVTSKMCCACKTTKPANEFGKDRRKRSGLESQCRECYNKRHREKGYNRLKTIVKYGLTVEQHAELLTSQNGVCAICKKKPNGNLCIDHCHNTNKVRGLLCSGCNTSIGLLEENVNYLLSAIDYLEKHKNI